jgi:restriction modification system, type I
MTFDIVQLCDINIDVIDGDRGKNYPHQDELLEAGHCLFLSAKNVTQNGFLFADNQFITQKKDELLNNGKLMRGDIVITTRGTVGNVAIYSDEVPYDNIRINSGMLIIRCGDKIDNYYLYQVLRSKWFYNQILSIQSGSAQPQLPKSHFLKMTIPMPNMNTQHKIAGVLSSIGNKISVNTAINENLEQQAQALYKAWFVDFEPFGGVMPDDWQIVPLDELCDSISKKHRFNKPELIFLNTGDVENGMVLHNNYSEVSQMPGQAKKSIAINDILYSEIRPINKHFTYVNFNADDYVVSTKLMVLRAKGISPRRLYQFLTMPDTLNELQHEAETRSGTFPQIRFDNIQQLEMIVASEQIENEYSERLNTIYSMIDSNNAENQRLAALRDTLLPKLMNGEIDVSEVKI